MATINAINNITPTLYGSSIANGDITIEGTSNATKTTSYVLLQPSGGNVGIGTITPGYSIASGRTYVTIEGTTSSGVVEFSTQTTDADANLIGLIQAHDKNQTTATEKRIAGIGFVTDGSTANLRGGAIYFYTKADNQSGANTLTPKLIINRDGRIITNTVWGTGTGQTTSQYIAFSNNGAAHYIGVESSTGGSILGGTGGYALAIGNQVASPIEFVTNNVFRFGIRSDGGILLPELSGTPGIPSAGIAMQIYMKADKFVIQFNDGGTVRYKYLDLTGTGVTWVHTTSAP